RAREKGFDLVEPGLGRVLRAETGRPYELLHHRPERVIRVIGRAMVAQAHAALTPRRLTQRLHEPRLADTGLAREQHDLTFTGLRQLPAAEKQCQFLRTADQRYRLGMVGIETALDGRLAPDEMRADRGGEAFDRLRTEFGELEHSAKKTARSISHDHLARFNKPLKAGGEVRGVAHHCLLLR